MDGIQMPDFAANAFADGPHGHYQVSNYCGACRGLSRLMEGWTTPAAASIDGIQRKANAEQLEILKMVCKVIDEVTGHITGEASHTTWKHRAALAHSQR